MFYLNVKIIKNVDWGWNDFRMIGLFRLMSTLGIVHLLFINPKIKSSKKS